MPLYIFFGFKNKKSCMLAPKYLIPPADLPLGEQDQYRVTGYYEYQEYLLIEWQAGDFSQDGEYITGESLYRNGSLVVSSGGTVLLAEDREIDKSLSLKNPSDFVNQMVDPAIGAHGVPQGVAYGLKSLANYRAVQIRAEHPSKRTNLLPLPVVTTQETSND
jgi:hypothetical protein